MSEWKVVPVEPTGLMVDAGREAMQRAPDLGGIVSANTAEVMDSYTAMLAAAPTPPVVLPPLPRPFVPGDEANPRDLYTADQMREYGRACERAAYERAAQRFESEDSRRTFFGEMLHPHEIARRLRALGEQT
jgi:hypothetical protein